MDTENEKFETGVQYLPGVGPKSGKKLAKLGVETIGDLIYYFPRKYLDYSDISKIADIVNQKLKIKNQKYGMETHNIERKYSITNKVQNSSESDQNIKNQNQKNAKDHYEVDSRLRGNDNGFDSSATIKARVVEIANKKTRRRGFTVTEAIVEDGTGTIKIVWFNQPYLAKMLWTGREIILHGKVNWDFFNKTYVMESPDWAEKPKIVPVYRETNGVSSYYISKIVSHVAKMISEVDDFLPQQIITENNLFSLDEAIKVLHTPKDMNELNKARERMAFDELFLISLRGQVLKAEIQQDIAPVIDVEDGKIDEFISRLPYELTGDQKKAVEEIIADISAEDTRYKIKDTKKHQTQKQEVDSSVPQNDYKLVHCVPMNRLLNGDVGSGKTVVAAIASYAVVKAGHKVMLMAPTEILAKQHYDSFTKLFEKFDINICLITSSTKNKKLNIKGLSRVDTRDQNVDEKNNYEDSSCLPPACRQAGQGMAVPQNDTIKEAKPKNDIIIGTHALLHLKEPVENVGLVVVDEQHRFGVSQRAKLKEITNTQYPITNEVSNDQFLINEFVDNSYNKKINVSSTSQDRCHKSSKIKAQSSGFVPHFLSMTATPIPRSLQLVLFGELEVSLIKEKPKNRKEIKTRVVDEIHRQKAYEFIRAHVKTGRQVFVICPLIEEQMTRDQKSKIKDQNIGMDLFDLDRKTVVGEYEKLSKEFFPDLKIGMLHGKMKSKEKDEIMSKFACKELDILVSTSVVEVGVDVPNASIMMIEDAERFGLAQLHQFRGRVGRGEHQSFCFLFSNSASQNSLQRLKRMEETSDGFKLAEFDLKNRGAGDIFGLKQSGFIDIRFADLSNADLVRKSSVSAQKIVSKDPSLLKYNKLKEKMKKFEQFKHFE